MKPFHYKTSLCKKFIMLKVVIIRLFNLSMGHVSRRDYLIQKFVKNLELKHYCRIFFKKK